MEGQDTDDTIRFFTILPVSFTDILSGLLRSHSFQKNE